MSLRTACFALLLLLPLSTGTLAQERILQFTSDVQVQRNGDLIVAETIRLRAEGNEIRRGILRDFPTTYRRQDGTRVVVGLEVRTVTRGGAAENYVTERLNNGVRIRIGGADRLIERGEHTYVITYRTTRQIGFFGSHDELYWNVTGTGWTFAIDMAEARITLPVNVQFRQTAFYTGPQDARGQDARIVEQQPGRIVFRTTRPLPPRNGLTIAAAWDKGVIAPPTSEQLARWWLDDYFPLAIGCIGLLILLGYYLFAWNRVGRDPAGGTVIPLFSPPGGMSAASVRYVRDMGFDDRCFTAAVVELGVNGYLQLTGSAADTVMVRRSGTKEISPAERAAWHQLFGTRPSLKLEQANHAILGEAKTTLQEGLAKAYYGTLFHTNTAWSIFGMLGAVCLAVVVAIAIFVTYSDHEALAMIFATAFVMAVVAIAASLFSAWWRSVRSGLPLALAAIFIAGLIVLGLVFVAASGISWASLLVMVPPSMAGAAAILAFYVLKAPTREGRRVMDAIEGFRQYLGVAEEGRLQFLHPPEKTPELFERFLPHAIALDVENAWANRFAAVLAAAAAAGAASTWYSGLGQYSSDPVGLADRLGSDLSYTIASASTAPGSSSSGGSSGGGSSGGGGGGGGGSGW